MGVPVACKTLSVRDDVESSAGYPLAGRRSLRTFPSALRTTKNRIQALRSREDAHNSGPNDDGDCRSRDEPAHQAQQWRDDATDGSRHLAV